MNCTRCGTVLPDNVAFCTNCGHPATVNPANYPLPPQYAPAAGGYAPQGYGPQGYYGPPPDIPDYLIWAILTTLCCQPFGCAAIVFAVLCMSDKNNGRYDSAKRNSKMARTMVMIGMICIALLALFYAAIFAVTIVSEIYNPHH